MNEQLPAVAETEQLPAVRNDAAIQIVDLENIGGCIMTVTVIVNFVQKK